MNMTIFCVGGNLTLISEFVEAEIVVQDSVISNGLAAAHDDQSEGMRGLGDQWSFRGRRLNFPSLS